jgi:hypothetical protein
MPRPVDGASTRRCIASIATGRPKNSISWMCAVRANRNGQKAKPIAATIDAPVSRVR